MVPREFFNYFAAASAAAGALIGLLFIAVSLRTDTLFGDQASPGGRAMAEASFIGLANSFFVSLVAIIPKATVGTITAVVAVMCLVETVRLHRRLARVEWHPLMLAASAASFGAECVFGVVLAVRPHNTTVVVNLAYIVGVSLLVALIRAWSLLQGRRFTARAGSPGSGS
jgi:hypothetical protein